MKTAAEKIARGGGTRYLLRDLFTTPVSAPLPSPRTCDPGPGNTTLVALATETAPSIGGGKLLEPRPTGNQGYDKLGLYSNIGYTRQNGLMVYAVVQSSLIDRFVPGGFLISSGLSSAAAPAGILFSDATHAQVGNGTVTVAGSLSTNTDYQTAIIARGNGYLYLIRGGTQFTNWTLLWVDGVGNDPVLYPSHQNFNADVKMDTFAVLQKTGPLARDHGKCVLYTPIVTAGQAYTGAADSLDYIEWTPGASETFSYYFRLSDSSNNYRLDCSQAGGTIKLFRHVAGVDTELAAGQTQTWTAGTPVRIGIVHAGGEIRTFTRIRGANIVAKHVVTGESFNLSATGVQATGAAAMANLEVWPRTFGGTNELDLS